MENLKNTNKMSNVSRKTWSGGSSAKAKLLEEGRVGDLNWTPYILAQVRGVAESPVECAFLDALADKQQPRHVAESGRRPSGAAS